jgi:putative ABC transport system permease protein
VRDLDADLPLYDARPLEGLVAESVAQRRFYALLLAAFAAVALVLAAVGIYGVIAYSVQQRSREFGIRLALGASPDRVVSMVMRQGLSLVALGTVAGLAGAAAVTRVLRGLLFDISVTDPATFAAVPVVLGVVAILACALPARRAIAVDPATAIRADG